MQVRLLLVLVLGTSLCAAVSARAGEISTATYYDDSTSRVSTSYTYTQAIDLGGSGETINGVPFQADSPAIRTQYQYDVTGQVSTSLSPGTAATDNVSGNSNGLELHYVYDTTNRATTTVTVGDLTVGYTYTTTFYDIGSGSRGSQYETVTDGDATKYVYDENYSGAGNGNLLTDTFTATQTTYTYTFTPDTTDNNANDPNSDSGTPIYLYGFSNQVDPIPEPSSLTLLSMGVAALLGYAVKRRRNVAA